MHKMFETVVNIMESFGPALYADSVRLLVFLGIILSGIVSEMRLAHETYATPRTEIDVSRYQKSNNRNDVISPLLNINQRDKPSDNFDILKLLLQVLLSIFENGKILVPLV
jgi:hypothetical protein